ncbi:MAG: GNAT family N-acetyltransferase [Acidimicrobiales bacterium]|jgi:2'-5' RNA ligase/ribosomal protein S18 acetylase RimI-like enzyme
MVPGRTADEIDGIRRALSSAEIGRIPPHLTLVPPVNVPEADVARVADLVRTAAAAFVPLALDLGPVTSFLPLNPVCYLAVSGERPVLAALESLVSRLRSGPLAAPASRRELPFVPHVTVNQHMAPERIAPAVAALAGYGAHVVFEGVTVLEFIEAERRWIALFEAPFGEPALLGRGGVEIELSLSDRLDPVAADWSRRWWAQYSVGQYGPDVRPDEPFAITARLGGVIAGAAEGDVRGATCRLARLMVAADRRGTGVGTQLLRATEHHAAGRGCSRVRLEALAGSRAEGFYRGRGYEVTATLPRWREGRDFSLMERALAPYQ